MRPRTLRRGTVAALSTGFILLAGAVPAAAHVAVTPDTAAPGGYSKLTFRVPDELPDASTVKVEVALPADQPVASVRVKPLPGWTVTMQQRTLSKPLTNHGKKITTAVSRIVWTGGKIQPGEFQEFDVNLGPLPEQGDSMVFKALQTYDNGDVVRWIDPPAADGSEPEHPAPVVRLVNDADSSAASSAGTSTATTSAPATATADAERTVAGSTSEHDSSARLLGGAALAIALLAIVLSLVTRTRPSRGNRS
jgi:periplasmic copper chaperone A